MSSASRSFPPRSETRIPAPKSIFSVELVAVGWESLSGLLFAIAVSPAVVARPWPPIIFMASLVVSALLAPRLAQWGRGLFLVLNVMRGTAWAVALLPVVELTGVRTLLGAFAFGIMSSGVRRALYRYSRDRDAGGIRASELVTSLNDRLAESTFVVGVVAGHILMLFLVAFLRTTNDQIRNAWWQVLPWLTLGGTLMFTLAVPFVTAPVVYALKTDTTDEALLARAVRRATQLPGRLALVNFSLWLACAVLGSFGFRHLFGWTPIDAAIVVALGMLFAWGISFYQRAWHLGILAPAVEELRRRGAPPQPDQDGGSLRRRMLIEFGLPLVFCCTLSLFSSLGLYRALVGAYGPNVNEILALVGSFLALIATAGGVMARAARDLSKPMGALAEAADRVGRGDLDAAVPQVDGPDELTRLGEAIERMRRALATTIAELESERASLEEKVEARTSALRHALSDLREAQAALLHGEKMKSLGQLVAGIAHEINNPLNAIAGSVESLAERSMEARRVIEAYRELEPFLPPEKRDHIRALRIEVDLDATLEDIAAIAKVIRRSTDRAVRIVSDLLHFSRASSEPVPTDVNAGIDEALSLLGSHLRHAGVVVTKDYGDLPELLLRASEVNQVFLNLLTNALQAVSDRKEPKVVVRTRDLGDKIEIIVEDNGPGVPAPLQTRIFDPFFTTKPAGEGTGLGLSISSQIVARHGGTLTVEEVERGGARFVLRLPAG